MKTKAQGTTEYLILIGLVIVISLIVVGVLGDVSEAAGGISESQSKAYWATTFPLALKEWKITSTATDAVFVFQNIGTKTLTITEVSVNGIDIIVEPDVHITAGSEKAVTGTTGIASITSSYEFDLIITYTSGSITGLKFVGEKPITGKVALAGGGPSCSCDSWSDNSCGGSSCNLDQMNQNRICIPAGCDIESRCIDDSCISWSDGSCGGGSCDSIQMQQTRTCTFDCDLTEQCLDDSCGAWGTDYCVNEAAWHDRTCTYDCFPTSELVDACDDSLILNCCNAYCVSQGASSGRCLGGNRCRCAI